MDGKTIGFVLNECMYADDTLLIEVIGEHLQSYMESIASCGKEYGLQLNWHKVEQMNIACQADSVLQPDGTPIVCKKSLKYLGIQLASDGHIESEVSLKFGRTGQDVKI